MGLSISPDLLGQFNSGISAVLDSNLVSSCLLFYPPKTLVCPNCSGTRSTFNGTGPLPFSNGTLCTYCNGIGQIKTAEQENIQGGLYRTPQQFSKVVPSHIAINFPEGTVAFKTYATLLPKLNRAQYLVFAALPEYRYIKYKEAIPSGFSDNYFVLTFWQRSQ